MWNRRHRWIRRFAAGLAFAALVVPTAQAKIVEDSGIGASSQAQAGYDGYGYQHGTGLPEAQQSLVRPDDRATRPAPATQVEVVRPDDRAVRVVGQPSDATVAVRPDDRADRFVPQGEQPQFVSAPSSDFSWSDAGIGAGITVALMLMLLGAGLLARTSRKSLAGA